MAVVIEKSFWSGLLRLSCLRCGSELDLNYKLRQGQIENNI